MKRFDFICVLLCISISGAASHNVSYTSSFMYQSGNPCKEYCDPRKCHSDSDCHKLDIQMKCVSGWCTCPNNQPFDGKCHADKYVGQPCMVSAECAAAGGYCEAGVCACYSNHIEFQGKCYKGFKALLGMEFTLAVGYLREMPFYVSDAAQEYQISMTDMEGSKYTFYFNEVSEFSSESINQASIHKLITEAPFEITLCAFEYDPPSDVNSITFGKNKFEMEIGVYDTVSKTFDMVCGQVCTMYFLEPEEITIKREGDQATANIDFHPLTFKVKLVDGDLDDDCTTDDDCKPLGSVCDGGVCKCDDDHIRLPTTKCCAPKVDGLGSGCSVMGQCKVEHSVCTGKSKCECKEGYVKAGEACVPE